MRVRSLIACWLLTLSACTGDAPGGDRAPPARLGGAGTGANTPAGAIPNANGQSCSAPNLTQACQCGMLKGRQVCSAGGAWGACECLGQSASASAGQGGASSVALDDTGDPPANKLPATFDWLHTDPATAAGAGTCRPGHYEGSLDGLYASPVIYTAPVPIVSIDVTGNPGLQFDLTSGGNGEFLTVTGGHVDGTALAIFPFRLDFADGKLDCSTGKFRAKLVNGSYDVFFGAFIPGMSSTYTFEGYAVANYDAATNKFVDGRWAVAEDGATPPAVEPGQDPPLLDLGMPGGTGTWTTTWVR
jgi:hypothetical protein